MKQIDTSDIPYRSLHNKPSYELTADYFASIFIRLLDPDTNRYTSIGSFAKSSPVQRTAFLNAVTDLIKQIKGEPNNADVYKHVLHKLITDFYHHNLPRILTDNGWITGRYLSVEDKKCYDLALRAGRNIGLKIDSLSISPVQDTILPSMNNPG